MSTSSGSTSSTSTPSTSTSTAATPSAPDRVPDQPTAPDVLRRAGIVAGAALIVNLLILTLARLFGADMLVDQGGEGIEIGYLPVAISSVAPVVVGGLLLLVARRHPKGLRLMAAIGLVVALVSVVAPVLAALGVGTAVALSLMHVVVGVIWFVVLRRATMSNG